MWRKSGNVLAVENDPAAIRPIASGQHVEAGGLSGAVRAHDAGEPPRLEGKRDVLENHLLAEALVQPKGLEQRHQPLRSANRSLSALCACVRRREAISPMS